MQNLFADRVMIFVNTLRVETFDGPCNQTNLVRLRKSKYIYRTTLLTKTSFKLLDENTVDLQNLFINIIKLKTFFQMIDQL